MSTVVKTRLLVSDLTPEQYKRICNGVGPVGFRIKCLNKMFKPAADQHDLDYYIGGTSDDRNFADTDFYRSCTLLAGGKFFWRVIAFVMYCAVTCLGYFSFHYGEKRCLENQS